VAYLALVAWIGSLVGSSGGATPFLAAFAVALCFHPARLRVQRAVDRLFYGRRGEPLALLEDLDRALREAEAPRAALQAAVEIVRRGLRLPGAAVRVTLPDGLDTEARDGVVPDGPHRLPLMLHGQTVGVLLVAHRRNEPLGAADLRALETLTGPLASVAYALRLSGDLEESRGRLLTAREEERRRLRRDLHDGLGPQLAGVVMGLDVVRSSLSRGEADRAGRLADDVTTQAREAVEEVRRMAAGLRPPVLDDLGLVGALRTTGPAAAAGGPDVSVEAEGDLDGCPAAVEVAAYRIAQEAITNAVRHAAADRVDVRLAVSDVAVTVTVSDDGVGLSRRARPGVGLRSMRERASELGGWCSVAPGERGGTTVSAHLPLGAS
jgi:signal transduction histidine kinase